ncbi:MAG TPA: hypothetical protein PLW44_01385 [Chitinophagales bacterium]|nr:hypothetical protein [Chitinophagales bacterium]
MRKNFTLQKLLSMALFSFALSTAANAQTASSPQPVKVTITEATTTQSGTDSKGSAFGTLSSKEMQATVSPWSNYKGIADAEQAKKAWITDNPEKWKAMQQHGSGTPKQK